MGTYGVSQSRACREARISRSLLKYVSRRDPQESLRRRIVELSQSRVRYGYRRIYLLLRREGWSTGRKRVYRLYLEEGPALRRKRPWRHVSSVHRLERDPAEARDDVWSMDFVSDELASGAKFRTLTIVDIFTRECLDIAVGQSLKAADVVTSLDQLKTSRGLPLGNMQIS